MAPLLGIDALTVSYATQGGPLIALDHMSIGVEAGETLALVGESGSGKSTVALAVMGLLGPEASASGSIQLEGRDIARLDSAERQALRGRVVSIVFQDPFTSLNPSLMVGEQVAEPLVYHQGLSKQESLPRAIATLGEVGLPNPASIARAYPHQLSGGMQQRVLIATAIICNPKLLILDEPTTALDVTVEAQILDLLDDIRRVHNLGMLFITHNLGVVNRIASRVCVLYAGRVVEVGNKGDVLSNPVHPYTKGLLASLPPLSAEGRAERLAPIPGRFPDLTRPPPGCIFAARCPYVEERCKSDAQALLPTDGSRQVRCWKWPTAGRMSWPKETGRARSGAPTASERATALVETADLTKFYRRSSLGAGITWTKLAGVVPWPQVRTEIIGAVDGVTLRIAAGEVLGLVGESGSGKSTLGRCVLRLVDPSGGRILFDGADVTDRPQSGLDALRKRAQIVFQNPDSSLNPRRRVGDAIARAVELHTNVAPSNRHVHTEALLERVGLPGNYYDRYPHQLSGGEKQRVGIARAIATEPDLIVCDEPVSALDVSVQATVLNLLDDLRREIGLSYLFISHDLSVVAYIADRIAVMYAGRICEEGPVNAVLAPPYHPYTEALLSAVPLPRPDAGPRERIRLRGDSVTLARITAGCPFQNRCPRKIGLICETVTPPWIEPSPGHRIACHLSLDDLVRAPVVSAASAKTPVYL